MIPVRIHYGNGSADVYGVVDSGAEVCMARADLGRILGIKIEDGEKDTGVGTGGTCELYKHEVIIEVGGHKLPVRAAFIENTKIPAILLGQDGFFSKFKFVRFEHAKATVELQLDQPPKVGKRT